MPEGVTPDQIVPAWWDEVGGVWTECGIEYSEVIQDGEDWFVNFQVRIDSTIQEGNCWFTTFAVMIREVGFTIDGPYFTDAYYPSNWYYPDSCYFTPERGPTAGDNPAYWVVLRDGDGFPPLEWIDVWLDDIRIFHDGEVVDFGWQGDVFLYDYDTDASGIFKIYFNLDEIACEHSPWHCAMQEGPHTIQFRVYDGVGHEVQTPVTPFYVDVSGPDVFTWGRYICHNTEMIATITDPEACILFDSVWVDVWNAQNPDSGIFRYYSDVMTFTEVENGWQARFVLAIDDLDQLMLLCNDVNELAVTWHAENTLSLENQENTFLYIVDLEPPIVVPVSPVGAPYDNDGDGIANEDPRDCINNDNDLWWDPYYEEWVDRIDEDWIDFVPDTLLYGERPTIQGTVNDEPICGSGASGVNLDFFHLFIDGEEFTADDAYEDNPWNFTIIQDGNDDAFFLFGGTDDPALDAFYAPGEHRVSVVAGDSVCGNTAPYPFSWTYFIRVSGPAIAFGEPEECGDWFDPEGINEFDFTVTATGGVPLAINGIDYSVYILPSDELISGPTVIDPAGQDTVHVQFALAYPFQPGDEAIRVHVTARNYLYDTTATGYNESDHTYAMDALGPVITVVSPADSQHFDINSSVVAEATFGDQGQSGVAVESIDFSVHGPDGAQVAGIEDLTEIDDVHIKWVSGELVDPGYYTINLTVGDCLENLSTESWTFFIEPTGPSISFAPAGDDCGDWFDPEGDNTFTFTVRSTSAPLAVNGISYRVLVLPDSDLIAGPEVIDPTDDPMVVTTHLAYPFQDDDLGIWIEVTARAVGANESYGITTSNHTYAIDNIAPIITPVSPGSAEIFNRDQAIVVEASFSDEGGVILTVNPDADDPGVDVTIPGRILRAARASGGLTEGTLDEGAGQADATGFSVGRPGGRQISGVIPGDGDAHLDDVGSGVDSVRLRIVKPDGASIIPRPGDEEYEVYSDHVKYTMVPNHIPGNYTINVTVWDCIGNYGTVSWPFFVTPEAPAVDFLASTGECQYDGFWNPDWPLTVQATIGEVQGINITRDGICLNIYRLYNTEQGVVEELLISGAAYSLSEPPSDANTAQVFTLTATPSLDAGPADIAVRFELVVADVYGTTTSLNKTCQIDRVAPWIVFLSPDPVVPEDEPVVIEAAFGDGEPPVAATVPGGGNGKGVSASRTLTGAPQQSDAIAPRISRATRGDQRTDGGKFGAWTPVLTGALDDLDGNSGVGSVELWLYYPDGSLVDLTCYATVEPQGISWTGELPRGDYTVMLKVFDNVCNEGEQLWSFRVANGVCPLISFDQPYFVSSIPHTFVMHVVDSTGIDMNSLTLRVEKHQRVTTDSLQYEHYVVLTDNAPLDVVWTGNTAAEVTYDANFYIENTEAIKDIGVRLTLCASDADENLCCASKNYIVDVGRPVIDGVTPSPDDPLPIDSRPTFVVDFHDDGMGIASATITLATLTGDAIAGDDSLYIAPETGMSGSVLFTPTEGLEVGQYMLRAVVTDLGGNVAMAEWIYRVGEPVPVISGKSYTWPNPFKPGETAHFELAVAGEGMAFVKIKVYDFAGQFVATVFEGNYQPGQMIVWNGQNDKGQEVANGVYLAHVVIEAGGKVSDEILKVAFKKEK